MIDPSRTLFRIRLALGFFFLALIASGLTAFPLQTELDVAVNLLGAHASPGTVGGFIQQVRDAITATYKAYPFIAYGTDWLAFAHIVIALFFLGPLIDPVRNIFILYVGIWACVLVFPLALICGPLREIPFYWRLVDCSFGLFGSLPLGYAIRLTKQLEAGSWTRFVIP